MSARRLRGSTLVGAAAALAVAQIWARAPSADEPRGGAPGLVTRPLSSVVTSSMSTVRWRHVAVRLLDGRVLVAGGLPDQAAFTTGEIYDPATGDWTPTGTPMLYAHDWPIAATLCDGRVFVAGRNDAAAKDAELYDPQTNAWIAAGKMKLSHLYGTATLLPDCRLLLVGGYSANTQAEIYNPAAGTFKTVGVMNSERFFHSTTVLADGRAIAVGGGVDVLGQWLTYPSVDIFNPATGLWTKAAKLHHARRAHTATLLPDGTLLVAGGTTGGKDDGTAAGTQLATSEIYDPVTDTWRELSSPLITARTFHTAALVPGGAVLLFGGLDGTGSASRQVEGYFEGAWQALDPLLIDRFQHASAMLDDGRVLVSGGVHQATAELYRLAPKGEMCTSNVMCDGGHCIDGVCCNEACDSGCRRCDVAGKEGTCSRPCADETHALVCSDGTATCANATCVPKACGVLRCDEQAGACEKKCASVADCAPGYACDLTGACVPPPDVSSVDTGSCSAAAPDGQSFAGRSVAAMAMAMALARRRRRADRAR
ncbi:MAG: kelch repeat-containing protein [Byssovorax sp.]